MSGANTVSARSGKGFFSELAAIFRGGDAATRLTFLVMGLGSLEIRIFFIN